MALTDYVLPARDAAKAGPSVATLRSQGAMAAARLGLRASDRMRDGDEFYFAARIHLGDRLFAAARGLSSGQVSEPLAQGDGIHILVMRKNTLPQPRLFDEVRDRVLSDVIADQSGVLTAGNDRFLLKRADIALQRGYE
jgi:hypothetical protein